MELWEFSANPNITWEIVQANPNLRWDYYRLSQNPNITGEIVLANPNKPWDYVELSRNTMKKWRNKYIKDYLYECYKNHYYKMIDVHEELIARIFNPKFMGCNEDEQIKRLEEELGFDSDED